MILLRYLTRSNVIVGDSVVASFLATRFAESQQAITLIRNAPHASQQQSEKTATLSVEADESLFQASCDFMASLKRLNHVASAPFLTARPGMVYLATSGTAMADCLAARSKIVPGLKRLTESEMMRVLPNLSAKNLSNIETWFNPESYQINVLNLVETNLALAAKQGAEIFNGKATLAVNKSHYTIWTDTHYQVKATTVFLESGAENTEILQQMKGMPRSNAQSVADDKIQNQQIHTIALNGHQIGRLFRSRQQDVREISSAHAVAEKLYRTVQLNQIQQNCTEQEINAIPKKRQEKCTDDWFKFFKEGEASQTASLPLKDPVVPKHRM